MNFDIGNTQGKAIHLVAVSDIPDLSVFGIGVANNGGGTDGQEEMLPAISVSKEMIFFLQEVLLILKATLELVILNTITFLLPNSLFHKMEMMP